MMPKFEVGAAGLGGSGFLGLASFTGETFSSLILCSFESLKFRVWSFSFRIAFKGRHLSVQ